MQIGLGEISVLQTVHSTGKATAVRESVGLAQQPQSGLAIRVLPTQLYHAVTHVFAQGVSGCTLVGGTALAGYYAGHRRSDDLDLFTEDAISQRATILAAKSLPEIGAAITDERTTKQFYQATCRLDGYNFTVQVVLDPNLFMIGSAFPVDDGVAVIDLETLLKMKAATLVSRCSEKDLYDLMWLFKQASDLDVPALIALGEEVDGGMNAEAVFLNLVGTDLHKSASNFSLSQPADEVFADVTTLQKSLTQGVESFLRGQPPPPIAELIRKLK